MSEGLPDSHAVFTDGDVRAARLLRDNLARVREQLAERPGTDELRRDLGDVLDGRLSMRELAEVPALRELADDGMRQAEAAWQEPTWTVRRARMHSAAG
ncbi:MAG: hypothetical protein WKF79_05725 [Nocardioides sp.]